MSNYEGIVLALSASCTALKLILDLSTTGRCDEVLLEASLQSILVLEPKDPLDVYPDHACLAPGILKLSQLLNRNHLPGNEHLWRYLIGSCHLAEKILSRPALAAKIAQQLKQVERQVAHFGLSHENTIVTIADIYNELLGRLPFKIYVIGKQLYLQQPLIRNQIRALLLSAVRSGVLWRQLGGRKYQFLFFRQRLLKALEALQKNQPLEVL